jgi:hypothetical protein
MGQFGDGEGGGRSPLPKFFGTLALRKSGISCPNFGEGGRGNLDKIQKNSYFFPNHNSSTFLSDRLFWELFWEIELLRVLFWGLLCLSCFLEFLFWEELLFWVLFLVLFFKSELFWVLFWVNSSLFWVIYLFWALFWAHLLRLSTFLRKTTFLSTFLRTFLRLSGW